MGKKGKIFVQLTSFVSLLNAFWTANKSARWHPPACASTADISQSFGLFYCGFGSPAHATNSLLRMLICVHLFAWKAFLQCYWEATSSPAVASTELCLTGMRVFDWFPLHPELKCVNVTCLLTKKQSQNSKMFSSSKQRCASHVFLVNTAAVACLVCAARHWDTFHFKAAGWKQRDWQHWEPQRDAPTKFSEIIHT